MEKDTYKEACEILKILLQALGAGLSIWCMITMLNRYENNDLEEKEQGLQQVLAGSIIAAIPVFREPSLYDIYFLKDLEDVISETE